MQPTSLRGKLFFSFSSFLSNEGWGCSLGRSLPCQSEGQEGEETLGVPFPPPTCLLLLNLLLNLLLSILFPSLRIPVGIEFMSDQGQSFQYI